MSGSVGNNNWDFACSVCAYPPLHLPYLPDFSVAVISGRAKTQGRLRLRHCRQRIKKGCPSIVDR
ncbi:hypothetical protein V6Z12_D02G110400 [Gossypium hirsutum]